MIAVIKNDDVMYDDNRKALASCAPIASETTISGDAKKKQQQYTTEIFLNKSLKNAQEPSRHLDASHPRIHHNRDNNSDESPVNTAMTKHYVGTIRQGG